MKKLKVHYVRVSSINGQNTDRQKVNVTYDLVLEDKCSGSIPFFDRPSGKKIKKMINDGEISQLSVHHPDRICRNMIDFLQTIQFLNEKKVNLIFISQGLQTLDDDGNENPVSKMVLSIMGVIAELERGIIKERVQEGIELAKAKGKYSGRKKGTQEDNQRFLNKPKNIKVIEYLRRGYKQSEINKITGVSPNTIIKIRKCLRTENIG
jgi:DNA invertase Pin-like site-specific DNA recombinase